MKRAKTPPDILCVFGQAVWRSSIVIEYGYRRHALSSVDWRPANQLISSFRRALRIAVLSAGVFIGLALPASAQDEWRKAQTDRFIIYGREDAQTLRDRARTLQIYDQALRTDLGLLSGPSPYRIPIYLISTRADMELAVGPEGAEIGGLYYPLESEIFIVSRAGESLLHEYHHHFMLSQPEFVSRHWLVEGLADYYMTAEIGEAEVLVGRYSDRRLSWLMNRQWVPLDLLLTKQISELAGDHRLTYNPLAALLVNWFYSSCDRRDRFRRFIAGLDDGQAPVEALAKATGLSIDQLTAELKTYAAKAQWPIRRIPIEPVISVIAIDRLPETANGLLLVNQQLKQPGRPQASGPIAAMVAERAVRDHEDPVALLVEGRLALNDGDYAQAEHVLLRLSMLRPNDREASYLLAKLALLRAKAASGPDRARSLGEARAFVERAAPLDCHYQIALLANDIRRLEETAPGDADVEALRQAFACAPQLERVRLAYAEALMAHGMKDAAVQVLRPLALKSPTSPRSTIARETIARLEQASPVR